MGTIADRTVSAALRADVTSYVSAMRAAAQATRMVGDEADRVSRRTTGSFDRTRRSTDEMNRAFDEADRAARRAAGGQREAEEASRGQEDAARRAADANEDNSRSASDAADAQEDLAERSFTAKDALLSLAGAGGAVGAAMATAGVGALAFAATSYPAISKVVEASQDLHEQWDTLSAQQKVSVLGLRDLQGAYEDLADSYEPQALAAFNTALDAGVQLLPKLDRVAAMTSGSVQGLINDVGEFANGPQMARFLDHVAVNAPEGLGLMSDSLTTAGELGLQLAEDLTPVGTSILTVLNGALGLVNGLAHVNPAFAQLAVTALLMRAPMTALAAGAGALGARMAATGAATGAMATAGRTLNAVAKVGPGLWIAAGTALAFFAIKAATAKSDTEKLTDTLRINHRAVGNNLEGHRDLAAELQVRSAGALQKFTQAQVGLSAAVRAAQDPTQKQASELARLRQVVKDSESELRKQQATMRTVETASGLLATKYQITTDQALSLATAAGVDLTKAMGDNGQLTNQAAAKIEQYRLAVVAAKDPTRQVALALDDAGNSALSMKDRVNALSAALDVYFNPSLAVYRATTQLRDGWRELSSAVTDANGKLDGSTAASGRARQAFAAQLQTTADLSLAIFRQTKDLGQSNAVIAVQLPLLYRMAAGNKEASAQVNALARNTVWANGQAAITRGVFLRAAQSMGIAEDRALALWKAYQKLNKPTRANVFVTGHGKWATSGGVGPGMGLSRPHMSAEGGPVPWVHGAVSGRDSVPSLLMPEEHVWTVKEVAAAGGHDAMYRLRHAALAGRLKKYARGGRVSEVDMASGSLSSGQVAGRVLEPITSGIAGMVTSMAKTMAAQWKKYVQSGGSVIAAARRWIGLPYSWGGGGPGGPSYGIGRGANTWGFDCSGLTEYAWWQGKRVRIGGVTYSQHPNSRAISGPVPGALGFNSSLGHVVLASNRPGYVIEAPYTGGRVQEVRKSMPDWRWPRGASTTAGLAEGGPVEPLAKRAVSPNADRQEMLMAKMLGLAGDPGRIPHMASGGWVTGPAGVDRAPLWGTAGEFMVRRSVALANPGLMEDINAGRVGEALLRRYVSGAAALAGVGGGAGAGRRGGGDLHVHVHNHGVIGNRLDTENWLSGALDSLNRQGRLPKAS